MKPFNVFVAISLIVILGGFVFLKDGFKSGREEARWIGGGFDALLQQLGKL